MLQRLNHIAIVVPDIEAARQSYAQVLGAKVSAVESFPQHGVKVVFIELSNTKIELLEPLDDASPVAAFLQRNPAGGLHHLCVEVEDVAQADRTVRSHGARVLGDGAKEGAHGKPVIFLHPKDFHGTLIELEEA